MNLKEQQEFVDKLLNKIENSAVRIALRGIQTTNKNEARLMKWLKTNLSTGNKTVFHYYLTSSPDEEKKQITLCPEAAALMDIIIKGDNPSGPDYSAMLPWILIANNILKNNWPSEYEILKPRFISERIK